MFFYLFLFFSISFFFRYFLFCLHLLWLVCNIVNLTVTMGGQLLMGRYFSAHPPMLFTIVCLFTVLLFL